MNPKVAVVAVAAILAIAVLLLVYGSTRPAAPASFDPSGSAVDRWLGGLRFTEDLTIDDLEAQCVDPEAGALKVGAGSACVIALPEKDTSIIPVTEVLTLSRLDGSFTVTLRGDDFDPQEFGPEDDAWNGSVLELDAYDANTRLTIQCSLGAACVVGVVEA